MRSILLSVLLSGVSTLALSQNDEFENKEVLVSEVIHNVTVALNNQTVLCSAADYGAEFLKILIPQLKDITLLDHRNEGAGAPCVAAGQCGGELNPGGPRPDDILDANKPTEETTIKVSLFRIAEINHSQKTCKVFLREQIETPIRNLTFRHLRFAELGERHYEDCL